MEPKATSLLLLKCVTVIFILLTSYEGANAIPRCCLTVSKRIPQNMIRFITRIEIQSGSGACEIDALILHIRNSKKKICAHPKLRKRLEKIRKIHKPK